LPESIAPSTSQPGAPVGAIVAGYVGLLVFPLVSVGVAIYMLTKKHVGHGIAMLVLSIPMFFIWLGIVAAIAIPKFANTEEKADVASMKADLRNLITAQEVYFADNVTYSHTIARLNYSVSAGNQIVIIEASGTGWSATAASSGTSRTCGIFVGNVTPPVEGEAEGAPTCQ
jgi:Tfp pilus assembly protein PilE